jgi:poly(3-hydroxybutyrate) depolymerase
LALALRVLERVTLLPPAGVRWQLPGTDAAEAKRLAGELLTAGLDTTLDARGYVPTLTLSYGRGAPDIPLPVSVELYRPGDAKPWFAAPLGKLALGARGAQPFRARLPQLTSKDLERGERIEARVTIGPVQRRLTAELAAGGPAQLARSAELIRRVDEGALSLVEAKVIAGTLRAERDAVSRAQGTALRAGLSRLAAWDKRLAAKADPLRTPGVVSLFRQSRFDVAADPILVQVPPGIDDPERRFPLVVLLHGMNGSPDGIMRAFVDGAATHATMPGVLIAPYAHGNSFYRGAGEGEVLDAIDWAERVFPIDKARVSITGVSMGGTGTAHIAFRHADRFSAAAPLCGYHSYFVRRDTKHRPLRDWELSRMRHWSPAEWAANGKNLPLWVAHGTKDHPLENSRVLVDRYRDLGYVLTAEWPDTGHAVWEKTYAGGRLFPWLSSQRREAVPDAVSLETDSLSVGRRGWVRLLRLAKRGPMARIDARVESKTRIVVRTENVSAFELERPQGRVVDGAGLSLSVDGQAVAFGNGLRIALARDKAGWQPGGEAPGPGEKRPGVEGPLRQIYAEPLLFVYGSGDPRTRRANREVARHFARLRPGPDLAYPVLADFEVDATRREQALFLVGTPKDHALLARWRLPIVASDGALTLGTKRFVGPGIGAAFVVPEPGAPERLLAVITGTDAAGIWQAQALPRLLPDFVVYDAALAPAAGEQVLGAARMRAAGFFDERWQLPDDVADRPQKP